MDTHIPRYLLCVFHPKVGCPETETTIFLMERQAHVARIKACWNIPRFEICGMINFLEVHDFGVSQRSVGSSNVSK